MIEQEERWKALALFLFVILIIGLTTVVKMRENRYDNPKDCQDEFKIEFESQAKAQETYKSKNCFAWSRVGNSWHVKCCNEGDVRYAK